MSNLVIMVLQQCMASGQAGPSGLTVHVPVVEGSCTESVPATAPGNQKLKDIRHCASDSFMLRY